MLFGSDWPVSTQRADYAQVVEVTEQLVEPAWHAQVFGDVAVEWYRLEGR